MLVENNSSTQHSWITPVSDALGGATGGYLFFPWEGIKKRLQRGELLSSDLVKNWSNGKFKACLHPKELFRGSLPFSTSVTVATFSSFTFNRILKAQPFYDPSSQAWEAGAAIASGMLGAICGSTPVENTILVQQQHSKGPAAAIHHMLKQGALRPWLGAKELMIREGGFAGITLFTAPTVYKEVENRTHNKSLAAIATLAVGMIGSLATHPADTVATYRQKAWEEQARKISSTQAIKELLHAGGLRAFFRGAAFRCCLFTGCALTIPYIQQKTEQGLKSL